jgi:hypothetical protein
MKNHKNKVATPSHVAPVTDPAVASEEASWQSTPYHLVTFVCEDMSCMGFDDSKIRKEDWEAFCEELAGIANDYLDGQIQEVLESYDFPQLDE